MANEKAMWQNLLRIAEEKGVAFGALALEVAGKVADARYNFDISRKATEMRAQLPTTGDMNTLRGRCGPSGDLRKAITAIITPVISAAASSNVTKDVVSMGVEAGKELNGATKLLQLADEKKDKAITLLAQVEDATEQAANQATIRIEARIKRAITDIDGV
jgi:predicted DNA-binding ribbon-helix-helix protein